VVLAVFLKEVPLRRVSGLEAARAQAAADEAGAPDPGGATHESVAVDEAAPTAARKGGSPGA
jgi:hypothetical protein